MDDTVADCNVTKTAGGFSPAFESVAVARQYAIRDNHPLARTRSGAFQNNGVVTTSDAAVKTVDSEEPDCKMSANPV